MNRKPSEVTDDYWVFADAPETSAHDYDPTTCGKWLVFVPTAQVDDYWETIREATEAGKLGDAAKAATARPNGLQRDASHKVICVYTYDWRDKDDVRGVLVALRDLGIGWRLSYKTDDATISGRYGSGTAIYVSQAGSLDFEDRSHGTASTR